MTNNVCGEVYTCCVCGEEIIGTIYDAYHHLNFECDSIKIYNDICENKGLVRITAFTESEAPDILCKTGEMNSKVKIRI